MSSKTITIDSASLKLSSKRKQKTLRTLPNQLMVNTSNIRQMLIDKLRKSRKINKNPRINTNTFDNNSSHLPPKLSMSDFDSDLQSIPLNPHIQVNTNNFPEPESSKIYSSAIVLPDRPYGVLKNGLKPTYKTWNLSQKNYDECSVVPDVSQSSTLQSSTLQSSTLQPSTLQSEVQPSPFQTDTGDMSCVRTEPEIRQMIQHSEIKKTYNIGKNKNNNSIGVLIKNIYTRKKVEEDIAKHKKTNITTVKNYLNKHNMIKHGTTAPTPLLRCIYENAKLCGDVSNDNISNIMHNFEKE